MEDRSKTRQADEQAPRPATTPKVFDSPYKILLIIMLSIFGVEGVIMLVFSVLPRFSTYTGAFFDASLLTTVILPVLYFFIVRPLKLHIELRKQVEEEQKRLILELQDALKSVKVLSGMLPICAACKKIRDDKGYWNQVEKYVEDHSEAAFTHSICPECAKRLYPEFYKDVNKGPDNSKDPAA